MYIVKAAEICKFNVDEIDTKCSPNLGAEKKLLILFTQKKLRGYVDEIDPRKNWNGVVN